MRAGGGQRSHSRVVAAAVAAAWLAMTPAGAVAGEARQIGGRLGQILKKTEEARTQLVITDEQEQEIGAEVSARIRDRYGVVQDPAVHRYVALVGTVLAQASSRPNLDWKFIVLDTDGVNAFAAPGGYIHITRGALALIQNEAELADVLGHEITHVTEKHTLAAIRKGNLVQMGAGQVKVTRGSAIFQQLVDRSTDLVLKGFGRAEELEADQKGIRLANSVGYSPAALVDFLVRLNERNQGATTKQGLFASHPDMQERLARLRAQVTGENLTASATLPDRYRRFISYTPVPQAEIATIAQGAAGFAGESGTSGSGNGGKATSGNANGGNATSGTTSGGNGAEGNASGGTGTSGDAGKDQPQPPPKKKGFGLGSLLAPGPSEKKSAEVTGSAAARGMDKELGAKGGPAKTMVVVTLTAADIDAFKKEGNLR